MGTPGGGDLPPGAVQLGVEVVQEQDRAAVGEGVAARVLRHGDEVVSRFGGFGVLVVPGSVLELKPRCGVRRVVRRSGGTIVALRMQLGERDARQPFPGIVARVPAIGRRVHQNLGELGHEQPSGDLVTHERGARCVARRRAVHIDVRRARAAGPDVVGVRGRVAVLAGRLPRSRRGSRPSCNRTSSSKVLRSASHVARMASAADRVSGVSVET